jgi:hypothetical protein
MHRLEDRALGGFRGRQYLGAVAPSPDFERDIGERAANIDT